MFNDFVLNALDSRDCRFNSHPIQFPVLRKFVRCLVNIGLIGLLTFTVVGSAICAYEMS